MSLVSFTKVTQLDHLQLKQAILDSLSLIHYRLPAKVDNVVIKPNMCYYWDRSTGYTTDPAFVGALIDLIRKLAPSDVDISVVESDASAMKCKYAFKILGYEKMAEKYGVNLVNLSEDKTEKVDVSVNGHKLSLRIPCTIKDADLCINVPKLKYMMQTTITCALKNVFGCNPIPTKYKFHPRLDETIVALNKAMKFRLNILDGIIAPGTPPRKMNFIMASEDPVAFDAAGARILGVNPKRVKHIALASREGLGNISYIPKGIDPKIIAKQYPRKKPSNKLMLMAYDLVTRIGLIDTETL